MLGDAPKRIAIRALGPSLADSGLTNSLSDPRLELHGSGGALLATNDNLQNAANKQEIIDLGLALTRPNESVILTTLPAGSNGSAYTR